MDPKSVRPSAREEMTQKEAAARRETDISHGEEGSQPRREQKSDMQGERAKVSWISWEKDQQLTRLMIEAPSMGNASTPLDLIVEYQGV